MAEPPKESVRSALPQKLETTPVIPPRRSPPPVSTVSRGESSLSPLRRPPTLPAHITAQPVLRPLPKPADTSPPSKPARAPLPSAADGSATSETVAFVSNQPHPKNETARITISPKLPAAADRPQIRPGSVSTSAAISAFDSIPRPFCWALLGISALIFLIQIWNYALS